MQLSRRSAVRAVRALRVGVGDSGGERPPALVISVAGAVLDVVHHGYD